MRKLAYIVLTILLIFAVNFTFWFMHTRTVNSSLKALKKQLALYKVDLTYDDLFYKNFKAWNVEGVVTGVKLKFNSKNPHTLDIGRLYITSQPFREHLEIHVEDDVLYTQQLQGRERRFNVDFHNGSPSVEVDFHTSLNKLADSIEDDETPQILRNVRHIKYYDSGFDLIDVNKEVKYLSVGQNKLSLTGTINKSSKKYDTKINLSEIVFDPGYPSDQQDAFIDKANIETGSTTINLDFSFTLKPSKHQLEFIEKIKAQDKDAKTRTVLDSFEITFKNADFYSSNRHSNIKGTLTKEPSTGLIPYMDIYLTMTDFEQYLDHYFVTLNHSINQMLAENPILPVKPIDKKQINTFKEFVSQFSENNKDLKIHIAKTNHSDLTISGRPIMEIVNEVQAIFFSNFTETPAPNKPNNRLNSRLKNVAK